MNNYIIFGILLTILEINKNILGKNFNKILNESKNFFESTDNFNIKPIGINSQYANMSMESFMKIMVYNYNIIQTVTYELILENTSENFMEDIIECFIHLKKNINDKLKSEYVNYYELLLILFIYCYYLEFPSKKTDIQILKINEKNKYKNNNICGYKYPQGLLEKIFDTITYNKKLLLESMEHSLFY